MLQYFCNHLERRNIMTVRLGYYQNNALRMMFRLVGQGNYAKTTGIGRKRVDAMLWSFRRRPAPA